MKKSCPMLLAAVLIFSAHSAFASLAEEYLHSAQSQMDGNNPAGAIENFKRAVKLDPNNTEALLGYASSEILTKHDLPQAKACLDRYISMVGEDERARRLLAVYSFYVHDYASAVQYFDGLITPGQKAEPVTHYLRGESLLKLGRYPEAIRDFSAVLEIEPDNESAFQRRGAAIMAMTGDADLAEKDIQKAIEIDPQADMAYVSMEKGLLLAGAGKHKQAIEQFDKALKSPDSVPAFRAAYLTARADSWAELGNLDAAIKDYTEAISLDPAESRAVASRAGLWQKKKEYRRAAQDYAAVLQTDPESAEAYLGLGTAYLSSGDQKFQAMDSLYRAGNLYAKRNDRAGLMSAIEMMSRSDPQSPLMQRLYKLAYPELNESIMPDPDAGRLKR